MALKHFPKSNGLDKGADSETTLPTESPPRVESGRIMKKCFYLELKGDVDVGSKDDNRKHQNEEMMNEGIKSKSNRHNDGGRQDGQRRIIISFDR